MIRVCSCKANLREAGERRARNERRRERKQPTEEIRLVTVCVPCGGLPIKVMVMPDDEELRGIVFPGLNDILCPAHALSFMRRTDGSASMDDLTGHLWPSTWNAEPWNPSMPSFERAPGLFVYCEHGAQGRSAIQSGGRR